MTERYDDQIREVFKYINSCRRLAGNLNKGRKFLENSP